MSSPIDLLNNDIDESKRLIEDMKKGLQTVSKEDVEELKLSYNSLMKYFPSLVKILVSINAYDKNFKKELEIAKTALKNLNSSDLGKVLK